MAEKFPRRSFLKHALATGVGAFALGRLWGDAKPKGDDLAQAIAPQGGPHAPIGPRVFRVGKSVRLELPLTKQQREKLTSLIIADDDGYAIDGTWGGGGKEFPMKVEDGRVVVDLAFPREGRYVVKLRGKGKRKGQAENLETFVFYALNEDLCAVRPYKGDFHMHSTFSDGVASHTDMGFQCLEAGYDVQALSDHRKYEGSQKLQEDFKNIPMSMRVCNAEEIHLSTVHVHSFGASGSVTKWAENNHDAFEKMVAAVMAELPDSLSDGDKAIVAKAEAAFEIVRKLGGAAGFDHPYWRRGKVDVMYLNEPTRDALFERGKFDYFELINASCQKTNMDFMLARYADMRARGMKKYPAVGVSDAHRLDKVGKGYTLFFATSPEIGDIKDALRAQRLVAVDASHSDTPTLLGDLRWVRYAEFLMNEFYPRHDALFAQQATLARKVFNGDGAARDALLATVAQTDELFGAFWQV